MKNTSPTIADIQAQTHEWITTIGKRYFDPLTNLGILMEETGELARLMVRIHGEQSFKKSEQPENDSAAQEQLADEMADVLWVLTCLANQCNVNLSEAWAKTIEKKTRRDADRHSNNPKL